MKTLKITSYQDQLRVLPSNFSADYVLTNNTKRESIGFFNDKSISIVKVWNKVLSSFESYIVISSKNSIDTVAQISSEKILKSKAVQTLLTYLG